MFEYILRSIVIGCGATIIYDIWGFFVVRLFRLPGSNWTLAGRWFCHMAHGRFIHRRITDTPPIRGETSVGWVAHYLIGVFYAAVLLALCGSGWGRSPTLMPALILGTVTIAAGWLVMAPAMGLGVASAKLPNASRVRAVQLACHIVFGFGLYLAARIPV